jgi:peroxiredoxin Q/BCP
MGGPLFLSQGFYQRLHSGSENFQRDLAKLRTSRAVVPGDSVDTSAPHKDSSPGRTLLRSWPIRRQSALYGSTMEYQGAKIAARNTFIINPKGKIAKIFTGVKPAEHSDEVLKALADLKKG